MALPRHVYIEGTGATCIWNTWIWPSFLLEYLMAWSTWANFTCRAIAWEHFQKVFFGISVASAGSFCRTTVWRNCPAVSGHETMWTWHFPMVLSFGRVRNEGLEGSERSAMGWQKRFWKVWQTCGSAWKVYFAELWEDFRRVLGRFQTVLLEVAFKPRCGRV